MLESNREHAYNCTDPFAFEKVESGLYILHAVTSHPSSLSCLNKHACISSTITLAHCCSYGSPDKYSRALGPSQPALLEPPDCLYMYRQPVNHIHNHHLLPLLSLKADTHFTVPGRVEG